MQKNIKINSLSGVASLKINFFGDLSKIIILCCFIPKINFDKNGLQAYKTRRNVSVLDNHIICAIIYLIKI